MVEQETARAAFSALELGLISTVCSLFVGVVTFVVTTIKYQTKSACDERHNAVCKDMCTIKEKQSTETGLIMRMLRSLIVHSQIPKEEQERILNDRATL